MSPRNARSLQALAAVLLGLAAGYVIFYLGREFQRPSDEGAALEEHRLVCTDYKGRREATLWYSDPIKKYPNGIWRSGKDLVFWECCGDACSIESRSR